MYGDVSSTTGRVGQGYTFDGTGDYINVSHSSSFAFTSAVTLSAWVKSDGDGYVVVKDPPMSRGGIIRELDNIMITEANVNPAKVVLGDIMTINAKIISDGIEEVIAEMPYEGGKDIVYLELINGTEKDGWWSGKWEVHYTIRKEYTTQITVTNLDGSSQSIPVSWKDPYVWRGQSGTLNTNPISWAYIMGYEFEPQNSGSVTEEDLK